VHNDLIFKSSPAAKGVGSDGHVHENGRTYIAEVPPTHVHVLSP